MSTGRLPVVVGLLRATCPVAVLKLAKSVEEQRSMLFFVLPPVHPKTDAEQATLLAGLRAMVGEKMAAELVKSCAIGPAGQLLNVA